MKRTPEQMFAFMESMNDEYLKFDRVKGKLSTHPDLHAFLLLEKLLMDRQIGDDIVSASEHDEIWLSVSPELIAEVATDEDLTDLVRCGVMYDEANNAFSLFT